MNALHSNILVAFQNLANYPSTSCAPWKGHLSHLFCASPLCLLEPVLWVLPLFAFPQGFTSLLPCGSPSQRPWSTWDLGASPRIRQFLQHIHEEVSSLPFPKKHLDSLCHQEGLMWVSLSAHWSSAWWHSHLRSSVGPSLTIMPFSSGFSFCSWFCLFTRNLRTGSCVSLSECYSGWGQWDKLKVEIYSLSKLFQSVARLKKSAFKSKLFTLPTISCLFFPPHC